MRERDRSYGTPPDDDGRTTVSRLGPPGWAEFSAARDRFMQTVTVAGLESAWDAPPREPRGGGGLEGPR